MKAFTKFLAGGAAIAALTSAAPAAAQYYPGGGYGGYGGGGIEQILGALLGQGQYGQGGYGYSREQERRLVEQCIRVTTTELERRYGFARNSGYGGYGDAGGYSGYGGYGGYPSNQGYGGYNAGAASNTRILGITNIQRRSSGGLRIQGTASSGRFDAQAGVYGGYGQGYGGYNQGYGQGYNQGYNTAGTADLRFNCSVDYRGRVNDVRFDRNVDRRYGY